jgi:Family of unknown function (DUF5675)
MEASVWMQLFARIADFLSSLSRYFQEAQKLKNPISSSNAPESAANSTSILKNIQENQQLLSVKRDRTKETVDAHFGDMDYNGFHIGCTMERKAVAIPEGTYHGYKRDSARFGMRVVGIDVPNRTDIECHPANFPSQLMGCIAVGESIDGGAIDNSRAAFDLMMRTVPETFTVTVSSS